MAISIIKQPLKFAPCNDNPVVFTLSSTSNNLLYYSVELVEALTQATLYTGKFSPPPTDTKKVSINLSEQLSSVVKYDVDNTYDFAPPLTYIVTGKTQPIVGYQLKATEYGLTGSTIIALGSAFTTDTFYAFDAGLDIINHSRLTDDTYVMRTNNVGQFLTFKPDLEKVNDFSSNQLYFLQDGLTGLTGVFTIGGNTYSLPITGDTTPIYTNIPLTPETRAKATISITGSSYSLNDNIGVYVNNTLLGSYTTIFFGQSTNVIAQGLAQSLSGNSSGYTISRVANNISIYAPAGSGVAGNSISLTTGLINSATTASTPTATTESVAVISGYTLPPIGSYTQIDLVDPFYDSILLATYNYTSPTSLGAYSNALVSAINTNPYGYHAERTGLNRISITGRTGLGADLNGTNINFENTDDGILYEGVFTGGSSGGSGITTTYHTILPHSKTGFTGGVTAQSAHTETTYIPHNLERMVRLFVSPKTLKANLVTYQFAEGEKYTVVIKDLSGNTISPTRTYIYSSLPCGDYINLLFVNSLAGVDSIILQSPQISINAEKQSILRNSLDLESGYKNGNIYNVGEEVFNVNSKANFKAYTLPLSDREAEYLVEMIKSRQHYIELKNGDLIPVKLVSTNYVVGKKRYLATPNQFEFQFEFDSNILPPLSGGITQ